VIHRFKSSDHPEADGRIPQSGEQGWRLTFVLEGGDDYLEIEISKKGRDALIAMLAQEDEDDRKEKECTQQSLTS
jgi:hypothetical protein